MASDFKRVRYLRPKYSQKSYHMLMKMLQDSLSLEASDVAQFRHHVLTHYYKYGLRPTLDAFKIKKSSLYNWRNVYVSSGRRISSLVPHKTRPLHIRKMETDWRVIAFIKQMRVEHGNIGKAMLKPFVDAYAKELGIPTLAVSTRIQHQYIPYRQIMVLSFSNFFMHILKRRTSGTNSFIQECQRSTVILSALTEPYKKNLFSEMMKFIMIRKHLQKSSLIIYTGTTTKGHMHP